MGITPAIGLYPNSRPDPLGDYLSSLRWFEERAPRVAYTGHREPVTDPAGRATEIAAHHAHGERAVTGGGIAFTRERFEERRLAGPIGPQNRDVLARVKRQCQAIEGAGLATIDGDMVELEERKGHLHTDITAPLIV
jgi:hypothetical protein